MELFDPNSGQRFLLAAGETLRLSRQSDKEFLNVRSKGISELTRCLWLVVRLQDNQ